MGKNTGSKVTLRSHLIEVSGSSEAWYGGSHEVWYGRDFKPGI